MKKASELSVLCKCQVGIIVLSDTGKLYRFSTSDFDEMILRYTECTWDQLEW